MEQIQEQDQLPFPNVSDYDQLFKIPTNKNLTSAFSKEVQEQRIVNETIIKSFTKDQEKQWETLFEVSRNLDSFFLNFTRLHLTSDFPSYLMTSNACDLYTAISEVPIAQFNQYQLITLCRFIKDQLQQNKTSGAIIDAAFQPGFIIQKQVDIPFDAQQKALSKIGDIQKVQVRQSVVEVMKQVMPTHHFNELRQVIQNNAKNVQGTLQNIMYLLQLKAEQREWSAQPFIILNQQEYLIMQSSIADYQREKNILIKQLPEGDRYLVVADGQQRQKFFIATKTRLFNGGYSQQQIVRQIAQLKSVFQKIDVLTFNMEEARERYSISNKMLNKAILYQTDFSVFKELMNNLNENTDFKDYDEQLKRGGLMSQIQNRITTIVESAKKYQTLHQTSQNTISALRAQLDKTNLKLKQAVNKNKKLSNQNRNVKDMASQLAKKLTILQDQKILWQIKNKQQNSIVKSETQKGSTFTHFYSLNKELESTVKKFLDAMTQINQLKSRFKNQQLEKLNKMFSNSMAQMKVFMSKIVKQQSITGKLGNELIRLLQYNPKKLVRNSEQQVAILFTGLQASGLSESQKKVLYNNASSYIEAVARNKFLQAMISYFLQQPLALQLFNNAIQVKNIQTQKFRNLILSTQQMAKLEDQKG